MKLFRPILLIILISLLPFLIIFSTHTLPHTSDGLVHLARMGAFYKALIAGHFPVRWASDLNYGYGMPLFVFIYHFPYYVSSLFLALGFSLTLSFKLVLLTSFILSGIGMYLFARTVFRSNTTGFIVAIFYQFAPFRLVEILVRGAIGGIYVYSFFPFVLYGLAKIHTTSSRFFFAFTAIAAGLLVISHNSLALVFFGLASLYGILFAPTHKHRFLSIGSLGLGLLLASYYWIPALLEHKYTYGDLFMKDMYTSHFPPILNFFIPNLLNTESLRTAEISVQFGIFHVLAVLTTGILLLKKRIAKHEEKLFYGMIIALIGTLFFMSPLSLIFWEKIALLRQFQFPWRLLSVVTVATAICSASFRLLPKRLLIPLMLLTITSTGFYWYPPQGWDTIDEKNYWNYPLNTTYFGETDLVWSGGPAYSYPSKRVEIASGEAAVLDYKNTTLSHTFTVEAKTDSRIALLIQFYPGWRVYVDGKEEPIQFQDANWRGLITFSVPPGTHTIQAVLKENKLHTIANSISIISVIFTIGILASIKVKMPSHPVTHPTPIQQTKKKKRTA